MSCVVEELDHVTKNPLEEHTSSVYGYLTDIRGQLRVDDKSSKLAQSVAI